jgi:lipopolysaccharide transport system permease protein
MTREMRGAAAAAPAVEARGWPVETAAPKAGDVLVLEPSRGWSSLGLTKVWEFRELLYFLVWRDIKVRYKQTMLGVAWAVVQPFVLMLIFTFVVARLTGLAHGEPAGKPYAVLVFAGLVPWTLFSSAITACSGALVANTNLVTKVYFPRLVLPIAAAGSYVIDLVLSIVLLFVLMAYYGIYPDWRVVALPVLTLLTLATAIGVGTWLTALNARYRDVRYLVPFMLQIWLFVSPIVYSATLVPPEYRLVYALNPLAGVIEGFRWALVGTPWTLGYLPLVSACVSVVILVGGAFFFRRLERTFADEL